MLIGVGISLLRILKMENYRTMTNLLNFTVIDVSLSSHHLLMMLSFLMILIAVNPVGEMFICKYTTPIGKIVGS